MDQKALKYSLIVGLTIVWSLIIYRVVNGLKDNNNQTPPTRKTVKFDYSIRSDSFTLIADYPDPFLRDNDVATSEKDTASKALIEKPIPDLIQNSKPKIDVQFVGLISNPESKKKIAIISISGKQHLVREKEKVDDLFVSKITKERVTVLINGKIEQIARQND
jgi:type II secretory pathway component PulC